MRNHPRGSAARSSKAVMPTMKDTVKTALWEGTVVLMSGCCFFSCCKRADRAAFRPRWVFHIGIQHRFVGFI